MPLREVTTSTSGKPASLRASNSEILALDLATKTGYVYKGEDNLVYGLADFSTGRMESYGMRFLKFRNFMEKFSGLVDCVYFEEVKAHKSTYAAQLYGGWVAVLTEWCETNNVEYGTVSVSDIKKRATGKGNSKKDKIVAAAEKKWPDLNIIDDNVADALWIMDIICNREEE